MSVYVSPQSSYSRGRGIRASEVAREMLETPNMGRCIEDLLPRIFSDLPRISEDLLSRIDYNTTTG